MRTSARHVLKLISMFLVSVLLIACAYTGEDPVQSEIQRPDYISDLFNRIQFETPSDLFALDGQRHMQSLPAVGREDLHSRVLGWANVAGPCEVGENVAVNPLDRIAELAAQARVTVINEAHDRPVHRYFIQQVAERLAPLGYRYFAAEAFDPEMFSSPSGSAYPLTSDGTYVNEPVFSRLIRLLVQLDYALFAYDPKNVEVGQALSIREQVERREKRQANRLAELIAGMPDDVKLLVHVGYSHAAEVPIMSFENRPLAWMAARLVEKTGLDLLTIDQTDCISERDSISLSMPSPRHVPGQHDLVIAHPRLRLKQHRPLWRFMPGIVAVDVPEQLLSDRERTIVEARYLDESMNAVPVDRIMLWPGESIPLLLPQGTYRIDRFSEGSTSVQTLHLDAGKP